MDKSNLKIIENEMIVAIGCDDINIDISYLSRPDKAIIVIYKKNYTMLNACHIEAKGFIAARRDSNYDIELLSCMGIEDENIESWVKSAEGMLSI